MCIRDRFDTVDSARMPPPKFAPIKKRKSKRGSVDFGKVKSAPTTPTERSPIKEGVAAFAAAAAAANKSAESVGGGGGGAAASDESDSEFGFDSGWTEPQPQQFAS